MTSLLFGNLFLVIGFIFLIVCICQVEKKRKMLLEEYEDLSSKFCDLKLECNMRDYALNQKLNTVYEANKKLDTMYEKFECLVKHLNLKHVPNAQIPPHFKKKEKQK